MTKRSAHKYVSKYWNAEYLLLSITVLKLICSWKKALCQGSRTECTFNAEDARYICSLEKETGPCRANYLRWHYDQEAKKCRQFMVTFMCPSDELTWVNWSRLILDLFWNWAFLDQNRKQSIHSMNIVSK